MIDQALASFLEEGIAIQLGTRNERLEPNGVQVLAVKVGNDGTRLVAWVPDIAMRQVLPDLESNGQAVYVTGPLPTGCDPTAGSATPTTIVATVREDTLAALGGNPPIPRRYLEWKGP